MTEFDNPIDLKTAIESQHGGAATLLRSEQVTERWEGKIVWDGVVHVFSLTENTRAKTAYAWSSPIEGSKKRRFFADLQIPPFNTAIDAVRAAIVAEHRSKSDS